MTKGFAGVYVLIILFIAVLGGLYYFGKLPVKLPLSQIPTPTQTPRVDETVDWKTYTNIKYGYMFQYPSDWELTETEDGKDVSVDPVERNKGHEFPELISVEVIDNPKNLSVEEYLKERWGAESLYFKYEPILIDNMESQRVWNIPGVMGTDDIFTKRGNRIYNINLFKRNEEISEIFNQILSTFRFD